MKKLPLNNEELAVQIGIVTGFVILILGAIIYGIALYQRRHLRHLKEKQYYEQALLQTQLEIQEQTLNTVAQEIHDNIGQILGTAKIALGNILLKEPDNKNLTTIRDQLSKGINDLRALTRSLHSGRIADLGLLEALKQELQTLQNTGQFTTQLQAEGQPYRLPAQQEMVLFRMAQEALHNAIKHSGGNHLNIGLRFQLEGVTLSISDNGKGFDPVLLQAAQKGMGLSSLQNRASLIGAQLLLQTAPGSGTTVRIDLPRNGSTNTATA